MSRMLTIWVDTEYTDDELERLVVARVSELPGVQAVQDMEVVR